MYIYIYIYERILEVKEAAEVFILLYDAGVGIYIIK
jgi:hypothetical protein